MTETNCETKPNRGKCLCGAISFQAQAVKAGIGACHCSMCRKWGGGPFMAVDAGHQLTFEGQEQLGIFDSSEWAERGFCKNCGTHLFYRLKGNGQTFLLAGLLEDQQHLVFDHQVFIEQKPAYYAFSNKTHNMTGEELFALFSGSAAQ